MCCEKISLLDFKIDAEKLRSIAVDLNGFKNSEFCAISPINIKFIADAIFISPIFPEKIILQNGTNSVEINQIQEIIRYQDHEMYAYEITCGIIEGYKATIRLLA